MLTTYPLASEEDAPMTLAVTAQVTSLTVHALTKQGTIVTGINQSNSAIMERKQNKHLRVFELVSMGSSKVIPKAQKQVFATLTPAGTEHYQRLTRFNRLTDPNLLALASTSGELAVLSFPDLEQIYFTKEDGDIYSLDFSPAENDTVHLLDKVC